MAPTLETKISSPNTVIKIITDVSDSDRSTSNRLNDSKELEKSGREHKESSSTQTSSSSSLLHKRKSHCYCVSNGMYKPLNNYTLALFNRPKKNINTTTQRIISAKFLRVKQLQSELTEAQKKISDLQDENRTLKNIQKRQDSALRKYESQESYLPQLLKSHEEEMRVITIKYKKLRNVYNDLETRHNKQCTELMNMKDRYKHLLQISQDKHLLQREQLTKQIDEMKNMINDLKNKIKLQSRRLDLENKNFKHQLSTESHKCKIFQDQLRQSQDTVQKLQTTLKDKERYMANCKISQNIINKMNQLRLKVPSNNLKSVPRICSTSDKNKTNETSSDEKQSNANSILSDFVIRESVFENAYYDSDEESASKINFKDIKFLDQKDKKPYSFESSFPSINQNNHYFNDSKNTGDITSYGSYFDDYFQNSNQKTLKGSDDVDKTNSDNNNNVKRNPSKDSILENSVRNEPNKNEYPEDFPDYDKNLNHDDTNSEKSEDFNNADDTVSWLELHEKGRKQNEANKSELEHSTADNFQRKPLRREDSLPYDKKTALLSALREIDLENNDKSLSIVSGKFTQNGITDQKMKNSKSVTNLKSLKNI